MDKISVIVPIYGIEKELPRCIDSIIAQTYKDLEIILVDDGSPDHCGEICDAYAKKDSRIKVLHDPNGGLSDARDHGIDAATGKYLGFVDGDDYIEPEMYEKLHEALVKNDAEISVCRFRYVGGLEERNREISITDEVISGKKILLEKRASDHPWGWGYAWNKLYKREVFSELRYPVGKAFEDDFIVHKLFWDVERVACISYIGYNYIQRTTSITHAYKVNVLDEIESRFDRDDFFREKHAPPRARYISFARCYYVMYGVYEHADFRHEPFVSKLKVFAKELKKRNRALLREPLSLSKKAFLITNYISPYYTWRLRNKIKRR